MSGTKREPFPVTFVLRSKNKNRSWDYRTAADFRDAEAGVGRIFRAAQFLMVRGFEPSISIQTDLDKKKLAVVIEAVNPEYSKSSLKFYSTQGVNGLLKAGTEVDEKVQEFFRGQPHVVIEKKKSASGKKSG